MSDKIGLKEAISIGIGGMVGGGIFAVPGLAVSLAQGGIPVAFLFAGFIALVTSYSYVKLSSTFPDSGGTVKFINEGFGKTVFADRQLFCKGMDLQNLCPSQCWLVRSSRIMVPAPQNESQTI